MTKVYLGIASRNNGSWGMFDSVIRNLITAQRNGITVSLEPHVGDSLICRARQEMTWKFLQTDCTHFMQLDDDIQLPTNAILKLVQANKPIVGGAYCLKYDNETKGDKQITGNGRIAALRAFGSFNIQEHPDELIKLKYLSTGCFLQKREVVEKMWEQYGDRQYWANVARVDKDERRALYTPMIYNEEYLSEDWAYCQRAVDAGYDIWLHTGVLCGHWGMSKYTLD